MSRTALRRCLYKDCGELFSSSSPAERVCRLCRKKHKAKRKGSVNMDTIAVNKDMERHMTSVELYGTSGYKDPVSFGDDVYKFLDDETCSDFDDSEIYNEIDGHKKDYDYNSVPDKKEDEKYVEKFEKKIIKRLTVKIKDDAFEF